MSLVKQRDGIVTAIERIEAYLASLGEADVPHLTREVVTSQRNLAATLRADYIDVHARIIESTGDAQTRINEQACKTKFLQRVESLLEKINRFLVNFPPPLPRTSSPNTSGDFAAVMERMMLQNQDQMTQLIAAFRQTASSDPSRSIKLPQIQLPTFSGKYSSWISFKDRFISCVKSSTSLNDVQKLEYLQSALTGDAESLIKHLPTTAANFGVAWELLIEKYERKSEIIADHVRTFYNMPSVTSLEPTAIQKISNILSESTLALDAINVTTRDPWLIQFTLDKLDTESRVLWGRECGNRVPTLKEFRAFLNQRCIDATNAIPINKMPPNERSQVPKPASQPKKQMPSIHNATATNNCKCCNQSAHPLYKCARFLAHSPGERFEVVKKLSLCRNCLASHHTNSCTFHKCRKCQGKHNVLLHDKFVGESSADPPAPLPPPSNPSPVANINTQTTPSSSGGHTNFTGHSTVTLSNSTSTSRPHSTVPKVFLATAVVDIITVSGQRIPCRVMLDGGAQVCIMTTSLYQKLRLPRSPSDITILGVGSQANQVKHRVSTTIFSRKNGSQFSFESYIMPRISGDIPNWAVDSQAIQIPHGVELADPQWDVQRPVDLLICGNAYWDSLLPGKISLGPGLPHLQETEFGYVLVGEHQQSAYVHHIEAAPALDVALQKFWELEDLPDDPPLTDEHQLAEAHFCETHRRDAEGRFVVKLPFRESSEVLGQSRGQAVRQFLALERQFEKKPKLKTMYEEVMKDYKERGWLELVPPGEFGSSSYYMPHHGVLKESSVTTKLRVVYNASAKTSSGYSLNDILMCGPNVQPNLILTLLRFRLHPIAMSADISKMYLQIQLDSADANFQRLVYRSSPHEPLRDYRIPRVCFGVASSPFLATRALIQLANDHEKEFPQAAAALRTNFYVDDLLVSTSTYSEAERLQSQLVELLLRGGFTLTKWSSNSHRLCRQPDQDAMPDAVTVGESVTSTLGMIWNSSSDDFRYTSPMDISEDISTKRHMASGVAKFFDPVGLMGPVIVEAKIMLQDMHRMKLGWDEPVPPEVQKQWKDFVLRLRDITQIRIPRWISMFSNPDGVELHAFCDASGKAYGVAIYVVTIFQGQRFARLLMAKSRVAPKKEITIPKLELCAATLAVETTSRIQDAVVPDSTHYWSDSTVVLHWINSPPDAYKIFVAKRIGTIREKTRANQWRHVASGENSGDIISRGASPSQLIDMSLWWEGPAFLKEPMTSWPPPFSSAGCAAEEVDCFVASAKQECLIQPLLERYSGLPRIQRIMAYVLRFALRRRHPLPATIAPINADEMDRALLFIIKVDQRRALPFVHQQLERNEPLPPQWMSLASLTPFADEQGLIRVGGRLENADQPFSSRHPILLPKSPLTDRIMRWEHIKHLHAGPKLLLSTVRQRFWPLSGRNCARKAVHSCHKCFRAKPKPLEQLMGNLPEHRVNLYRPFQATGVDFAGPLLMISSATRGVRSRKAGNQKVYIAIFVCMATKAAHLEIVCSLSTEAFLAAFRRFAARRTTPRHLYSDCGKNFEGAANEFVRLLDQEKTQQEIVGQTQTDGISWHFNPPASPHHGGLWEACVKSTKFHLIRAIGSAPVSYEELHTTLCQIECVLNSRPLCTISEDPNDGGMLTPGHFLVGAPGNAPPDPDVGRIPENRLSYWQQCQRRAQEFGKRWRLHYLNTLQQRPKWRVSQDNLEVGEVVLLLDDTAKEGSKWILGRVETAHPGGDGKVRVVTVRTARGVYKRPIVKIARLPKQDEEFPGLGDSNES
ncbi:uncharacterized protein LOC132256052 [Phlebotomus argentipes]|uniref:uncharacterized protein LOC132256052 n=1 Tax=Phlebotomus argentipes TaxID=94469 RepID=UPI0028934110|nr:uncharacterized protein LOC132256052 [Phlebotomus argentipes]